MKHGNEAAYNIMTPVFSVIICLCLFAIGTTIVPKRLRDVIIPSLHNKDSVALAMVLVSTIFIQPALGFGIVHMFSTLSDASKLAIMLVSCAPGGPYINIISALSGANVPLNAACTCIEALAALVLVPAGVSLLMVTFSSEGGFPPSSANATAPSLSEYERHIFLSTIGVVGPLGLGVCIAPWAERCPFARRTAAKVLLLIVMLCVVTSLVVAGVPPVSKAALGAVGVFLGASLLLSLTLALLSRQPLANVVSMVLEINVRDMSVANGVVMIGFAAQPFTFRMEAIGVNTVLGLITIATSLSWLVAQPVLRRCRRRAASEQPLMDPLNAGLHAGGEGVAEESHCEASPDQG